MNPKPYLRSEYEADGSPMGHRASVRAVIVKTIPLKADLDKIELQRMHFDLLCFLIRTNELVF